MRWSCRRRLARRVPHRLRTGRSGVGGAAGGARVGDDAATPARRQRFTYLGFGWVPKPSDGRDAGPAGGRGRGGLAGHGRVVVPAGHRGVLRGLHLDRADRRHDLPQPLLVREPGRPPAVLPARRRQPVDERPGGAAERTVPRWAPCTCCGPRSPWCTASPGWPSSTTTGWSTPCRCACGSQLATGWARSTRCSTNGGWRTCCRWPARRSTAPSCPCCCGGGLGPTPSWPSSCSTWLTWRLFAIGVFPWLMIAGATLFFAPDWPRRRRRADPVVAADHTMVSDAVSEPIGSRRASRDWRWRRGWPGSRCRSPSRSGTTCTRVMPRWTNEGYRFSWNVLATERAGEVAFRLTDPDTGVSWVDDARHLYTPDQWQPDGHRARPDPPSRAGAGTARPARTVTPGCRFAPTPSCRSTGARRRVS